MPLLRIQLVGLPERVAVAYRRPLKLFRAELREVLDLRLVTLARKRKAGLGKNDLRRIDDNIQEGFTVVAGIPSRDFDALEKRKCLDCRMVRLAVQGDIFHLVWQDFHAIFMSAIDVERHWAERVRPQDLRHPLLLPPEVFTPTRQLEGYWKACDCYGSHDAVDDAERTVRVIWRMHRKKVAGRQLWVDRNELTFPHDTSWHGRASEDREGKKRFRFCFEVAPGFHYDVQHLRGQGFSVRTKTGDWQVVARANVDPWGSFVGRPPPGSLT